MTNVIQTRIKFYRNLKDYKFVPKLTEDKKQEIVAKVDSALDKELLKLDVNTLDQNMRDYLNQFSIMSNKSNTMFITKDNVAITFFDGEHLTICAGGAGLDKTAYTRAKSLEHILSSRISLAYNDMYGYLMSDLKKIGCGLNMECDLDLHAINSLGKINQVRQNIKNLGFNLIPKNGQIFTLSTGCNLGFAESEIQDEFMKMVSKLQDLEIESAKMLASTNSDELMDKAFRSLAILQSAYLLSKDELNNRISDIRLGVNLGYIDVKENKIVDLQHLVSNKSSEFVTRNELIDLASKVKKILKGE